MSNNKRPSFIIHDANDDKILFGLYTQTRRNSNGCLIYDVSKGHATGGNRYGILYPDGTEETTSAFNKQSAIYQGCKKYPNVKEVTACDISSDFGEFFNKITKNETL